VTTLCLPNVTVHDQIFQVSPPRVYRHTVSNQRLGVEKGLLKIISVVIDNWWLTVDKECFDCIMYFDPWLPSVSHEDCKLLWKHGKTEFVNFPQWSQDVDK